MQSGTTDKPRLGYAGGGKIQCMAGGGLVERIKAGVNKLVGNNPGAMAARGRSEEADAPPPSTTGTTAPIMETVKKAKGGSIPKPPKGAAPHPESTGTDTVPIMGTPGEFMVRKPAVDKIEAMAPGLLNALNSMGDDKPKLGKVKRRRRGKRKPMEMGGPVVDDARFMRPARAGQMLANQSNPTNAAMVANGQNPAYKPSMGHRGTAMVPYNAPAPNFTVPQGTPQRPALPAPTPGTAVATTPPGQNFTMPKQFAQPPNAPLALPAPAAAPLPQVDVQRQQWQGRTASPQAQDWLDKRPAPAQPAAAAATPGAAPGAASAPTSRLGRIARTASNAVGPIGVGLAAIPEALDTATVAMNPNATGIDVATQGAQGASRVASAGLGAAGGAALGAMTGPLAPVAVPLGAIAGGALGYFGADKAIQAGRTAVGSDPRAPVDMLPQPAPAAIPAAAPPRLGAVQRPGTGAGAGQATPGFNDPRNVTQDPSRQSLGASRDFTKELAGVPKNLPGDLRQGVIYKTMDANGNPVYSGANVGPDAQMVDGKGATVAQRGNVNVLDMSEGRAQVQRGLARLEAEKAAKSDPIEALINNGKPMTVRKAAAIAQMQAARAQAQNAAARRDVDAQRLAMDRETADLSNREKKSILSAQDAYANAKTPAEKDAAENRLRAITQKWEKAPTDEYAAIAGGTDENGARRDPLVYSKRTGETKGQPTSTTATPRAQYDAMKKGDRYIGTDGKQYIKG